MAKETEAKAKHYCVKDLNPHRRQAICFASTPGNATYKSKPTMVLFWLKAVFLSMILFCGVQSLQIEPNQFSVSDIRNRVTVFVSAHAQHSHYCNNEPSESFDCSVQMSIKVWNYGEDNDDVSGMIEELSEDGSTIKVKVDCMARSGINAIVGGDLIADHSGIQDEIPRKSRALFMYMMGQAMMKLTSSLACCWLTRSTLIVLIFSPKTSKAWHILLILM